MKTYSTESHDEALNYIIENFGFNSKEANTFYVYEGSDKAVDYARSLGWDIED